MREQNVSTPWVAGSNPAGIAPEIRYKSEPYSENGPDKLHPRLRTDADQSGRLRIVRDTNPRKNPRTNSALRNIALAGIPAFYALCVIALAIAFGEHCPSSGAEITIGAMHVGGCRR